VLGSLLPLWTCALAQIMGGPEPPKVTWEQHLGASLPLDARFVDHEGRTVTLAECLGKRPVVLALVYYECPMLCGLVLQGMIESLRAVDFTTGEDFDVLVLSIDPGESSELAARKRASSLEAYGRAVGSDSWRFLVGQEADIRRVADAVGFGYSYIPETDQWAHAAGITVLTPQGVVSRVLFGVEYAPRDLRLALVEASRGAIGSPVDQILLRCFEYDPTRGKYGLAILTLVRFLGALTALGLAFLVWRWLRLERRARTAGPLTAREG